MKRLLADVVAENRAALHAPTPQPIAPERILVEVAVVILAIGLGCVIVWWFA